MSRKVNRLSAVTVRQKAAGKFADGNGLWLIKSDKETGKWVLRISVHGRRREMGLGSIADVSLQSAREKANSWRTVAKEGRDPIKERERQKRDAIRNLHILKDVAIDAFESRKAELREDGKAGRWFTPLALHVLPKLGQVPVAELDQVDIRDTLAPIWHVKAETARKALNRLNIVIRHAAALGLNVDLQVTEKAKALLGQSRHKPSNIPAMNWRDVPEFYATLNTGTVTQLALRLLILTGVRSKPLRFLRVEQIEGQIWTIPAESVKGRKGKTADFRVPLSREALDVIANARRFERGGYLFPSVRRGVISDATMARYMERENIPARPHGFRSSLRDWLAEATDASEAVAETILGHSVGSKTERAYRRTDYFEQRQVLASRWADFVTSKGGQLLRVVNG